MRCEGGGMRSKVVLSRISTVLFLGALVALLIGLTMRPRFANADGACSSLLNGSFFRCSLGGGEEFGLKFGSNISLTVQSFGLNETLGLPDEISTNCLCVGPVNILLCPDLQDTQAILLGRVNLANESIKDGRVIVLDQDIESFSCWRVEP
jgi:hypothetical protein